MLAPLIVVGVIVISVVVVVVVVGATEKNYGAFFWLISLGDTSRRSRFCSHSRSGPRLLVWLLARSLLLWLHCSALIFYDLFLANFCSRSQDHFPEIHPLRHQPPSSRALSIATHSIEGPLSRFTGCRKIRRPTISLHFFHDGTEATMSMFSAMQLAGFRENLCC